MKQRSATLYQLEEVYAKIEQAADQADIVRVMQASTNVLRTLNKQVGGVEKVEDVVEELRREMANVEEVNNVVAEPVHPIDEAEVDDELEEMEMAEKDAAEEREAEAIRQKLAELDRKGKPEAEEERGLEENINRLSNMSLDDTSAPEKSQAQNA